MKQSTATINAILSVLSDRDCEYELNGPINMSEVFTKQDKEKVSDILVIGFKTNQVDMSEEAKVKYAADDDLKKYVGGLISNWVRKHKEFNGGNNYTPSFTRETDPQIKELRKLLSAGVCDEATTALVEQEIEKRKTEIKPERSVEIDVDLLPEHLRYLVG